MITSVACNLPRRLLAGLAVSRPGGRDRADAAGGLREGMILWATLDPARPAGYGGRSVRRLQPRCVPVRAEQGGDALTRSRGPHREVLPARWIRRRSSGRMSSAFSALGGSTVQGHPFSVETSFTTWLELSLKAADPSRHWRVVNCAGVSYATYREAIVVKELLGYKPDLLHPLHRAQRIPRGSVVTPT